MSAFRLCRTSAVSPLIVMVCSRKSTALAPPPAVTLKDGDRIVWIGNALVEREQAHWPPFARVAVLRAEAPGRAAPLAFLEHARELLAECSVAGVEVLGITLSEEQLKLARERAEAAAPRTD